MADGPARRGALGFTLLELLVTIGVLGVLIGVLAPALAGVRSSARTAVCLSNTRQLGAGWRLYAFDHDGAAMPLAYTLAADVKGGPPIYWWGALLDGRVDRARGFIAPYVDDALREGSVFECPEQPWGSYEPQGADAITSTYGYNGYYLCPPKTPGWSFFIGAKPWKRLASIRRPSELLTFADTLLPSDPPSNNALLDPPQLFFPGVGWQANTSPTTCFRHGGAGPSGRCAGVRADGSAHAVAAEPTWLSHPGLGVGSIGVSNGPHYVPDWRRW